MSKSLDETKKLMGALVRMKPKPHEDEGWQEGQESRKAQESRAGIETLTTHLRNGRTIAELDGDDDRSFYSTAREPDDHREDNGCGKPPRYPRD
jgi:hypothetical protein